MRKNQALWAFAALAAAAILAGCTKEKEKEVWRPTPGTQIIFGASTSWFNGADPSTRTEYSGKDENGNAMNRDSGYERIDWKAGYDQIRILCDAAANGPVADYNITGTVTASAQKSQASMKQVESSGLRWGTGDHYFYAMYPVPGMSSNYDFGSDKTVAEANAKIESTTVSGSPATARITGVVPAEQHAVKVGNEYKANMNYAYMYAAALVKDGFTPSEDNTVTISFHPLVTMFEITLKQMASDPMTADLKLTKVELSAPSGKLSGKFQADLSFDSNDAPQAVTSAVGTTGNTISLVLPDGGVVLGDDPIKVNLLALPLEHTNLTLTLYFGTTMKRTLELKDRSLQSGENPEGWVVAPACKKVYFSNLAVPANMWTYTFDVTGDLLLPIAKTGGNIGYGVTSYRTGTVTGVKQPVSWIARFSKDGIHWTETVPDWLTNFTETAAGSISETAYNARAAVNDQPAKWEGSVTPEAVTKATAVDLSCHDIYGTFSGGVEGTAPYNTANCYVVSAPGWYRLPCVYGNAIKNGANNPTAYTGPSSGASLLTGGFLNHAGNHITAPWIKDNGVSINGAELLWQDVQGLITQISYENDYIYFYVDPTKIFEGNALLAAKSGSTVVWSWHIWFVDNPLVTLVPVDVYSHPTNNKSVEYPVHMLPKHVGFCDGVEGKARARYIWVKFVQADSGNEEILVVNQFGDASYNCTYYQFGRKDPLVPGIIDPDSTSPEHKALYDINGASVTLPDHGQGRVSLAEGIKNPTKFYRGAIVGTNASGGTTYDVTTTKGNWTNRYDNLWNTNVKTAATNTAVDVKVNKTIYDPCPPGFKTPNKNAFSGFTSTGENLHRPCEWSDILAYQPENIFNAMLGHLFWADANNHSKGVIFLHRSGSYNYGTGLISSVQVFGDFNTATPVLGTGGANSSAESLNSDGEARSYLTFGYTASGATMGPYLEPFYHNYRAYGFPTRPIAE